MDRFIDPNWFPGKLEDGTPDWNSVAKTKSWPAEGSKIPKTIVVRFCYNFCLIPGSGHDEEQYLEQLRARILEKDRRTRANGNIQATKKRRKSTHHDQTRRL